MIDTWQVGSQRVYVPSSFHGKLTLAFEVEFLSKLERRSFFEFSSSSKVKIWTFLAFSLSFELRNRFPKVFEKF